MGSASFEFLGFSAAVILVLNLAARSVLWRQAVLLVASIAFLSFFSHAPQAWLPLVAFLACGYASLRAMQSGKGKAGYAPILIGLIFAYVWLKKYTFLPEPLFLSFSYVTLGLSYVFFRVLHVVIDAHDGLIAEPVGVVSYVNYTLNFTTFVSGPIQRYQDFASMQLSPTPPPLDVVVAGEALERIIIGFFKVNVLSLLLAMLQTQALNTLPVDGGFAVNLSKGIVIAAVYPLYLYFNFSGYIDIVIGVARFLRIRLPENFNRPFSADNFLNFWSRWHITLSEWLKTYVYNPLLMTLMRRFPSPRIEPFLGVLAFFVTFFLIGVWHGRTSVFLFFGVLQGLGVSVNKLYQVLMAKRMGRKRYRAWANNGVYNCFARGLTFTWFTFTLLWFWSNWQQLGFLWNRLGFPVIVAVWAAIFLGSSVVLAGWEWLRSGVLSLRWGGQPVLLSRYVRTVWGTALAVLAVATAMLLSVPAPDVVYKAF